MTKRPTRSGGRAARHAKRAIPVAVNPAAPGQIGGQYRPLSEQDCTAIYDTALRLLSDLGMGEVPKRLWDDLTQAGCTDLGEGRIGLPRALVEDIIDKAAKTFPLHGRDPNRTIEVGGDKVFFGTGGAAVNTLDRDTGLYRPSTLQDLHDFTRLQDALDNVAWFTRCCIATDVPDMFDLDVNTAYALMRGTTKPVATAFTIADHVDPIVHLFDIAAGGEGEFSKRPFVKIHISPVISPMRFGEDAVDVVYKCIEHNIPMSCITAAQAGATAPATMAGFLAMSLAETLASLVMVNVISPGFPMVFSNWPLVIDLRSGAFAGGSGETTLLNAASAQMSNWLGLPSGVAASMTDAKAIDAQYGVEKGMTSLAAALAGGNLIYESSGMTASLLGASFEGFVLDDEMHAMTYRTLRGVEVSEDNLGYDAICAAILGDGHFLGADHTYRAMERDYHYPKLADREQPKTWADDGAQTAWDRAKLRTAQILTKHNPAYLTPEQDAEIRAAFNILG
ncbi:trimethylamine methyltransferase family protein [Octadecabacter sp. 1_MG-2023]|uniref:trimethylamine methyltransferase family protein n=1 Tax=unclassified Octadecabacter TaxID=196158 RepID=UPI001C08AAB5|nr:MULTISPECIES: trimethylamine methyltransferase family protein [unclassified Octadecabacter]MBU2994382.1 trimethylamine methyltransferase family protein [Octadecabacter sp. B2R22]MDO6734327.1 trimethylamine methyltransferase family protein [Octadecabacter sp. 1_MG-2023]